MKPGKKYAEEVFKEQPEAMQKLIGDLIDIAVGHALEEVTLAFEPHRIGFAFTNQEIAKIILDFKPQEPPE